MKASFPPAANSAAQAAPEQLRHPPGLKRGDLAALISPSGHLGEREAELLAAAREVLGGWGLEVAEEAKEMPRRFYLAGSDAHRAAQFQRHYCDPAVKALFFTRGGYGAGRMLPLLDHDAIRAAPPKAVVGFSDATALFAYLNRVAGVSAIHGPCIAAPALMDSPDRGMELEALHRLLFEPPQKPLFTLLPLFPKGGQEGGGQGSSNSGSAEGRVVGGCLSVLVTTLGTPWEVDMRGALLFLEEVGEAPYRLDRMLTHLRAAGKFDSLAGLLFGRLHRCDGGEPGLVEAVLRDLFAQSTFPIGTGLSAGHGSPNLAFPLGREARLNLPRGRLEFL